LKSPDQHRQLTVYLVKWNSIPERHFLIISPNLRYVSSCLQMTHQPKFSTDFLHKEYPVPELLPENVNWVIVREEMVGVATGNNPTVLLTGDPNTVGAGGTRIQYLGHEGENPVYAVEFPPGTMPPEGMEFTGVRELFCRIPDRELALAGLAVQAIDFDRTTRFCGECGSQTVQVHTERAKRCPSCNLVIYPQISPAIIVLIKRGDQVLLARSPRFPPGMFSVIAGFVEQGENLEHTIHREVKEETGILVRNIRYFGSEPWPFPHSLMIGFTADYAGGDIVIDAHEIESAFWFDREHLPRIPERMSISRALINSWLEDGKQV
jgi:NAD+ diphosphatase